MGETRTVTDLQGGGEPWQASIAASRCVEEYTRVSEAGQQQEGLGALPQRLPRGEGSEARAKVCLGLVLGAASVYQAELPCPEWLARVT